MQTNVAALSADINHINSIAASNGLVSVDVATFEANEATLNKVVGGFGISDTAATVGSNFDALEDDIANIQAITFTDTGTPTLQLTEAQYTDDAAALAKIDSPYDLVVTCYVRGTLILTEMGEVAVEKLAVGDRLLTASGEAKPIKWIGRRSLDCLRRRDPESAWPICVSADAFGARKPSRDLWLSPGHNIAVEGMLMPIRVLQNGRTVVQHQCQTVEYWHVELESHDIIIANGLRAESYLDTGNRTAFVNGGAFIEAHPDFEPRHWAATCLPLVFEGAEVTRTKARLLERLKGFGHLKTSDADLHVMADGKRIDPLECGAMQYAFALPTGRMDIRLVSRTFIPAHTLAESTDTRSLGICVGRLQIGFDAVALDSETLVATEWHEAEPGLRWTRGNVTLPPKTRLVVIDLAGPGHYWRERKDNVVALYG